MTGDSFSHVSGLVHNNYMQIAHHRQLLLIPVLFLAFTSAAWCSRGDKGGSTYGINASPCAKASGPQSPTTFGSITASCFSPGSGVGNATLFELTNNASPFPSTLDVSLSLPGPQSSNVDFGLILCDSGTVPCTNKDSSLGSVNPVDFASTPSFGTNTTLFTFTNFTGELAFYVDEPAIITNVTGPTTTATPEPQYTAVAGLLLLLLLSLTRRFGFKRQDSRA